MDWAWWTDSLSPMLTVFIKPEIFFCGGGHKMHCVSRYNGVLNESHGKTSSGKISSKKLLVYSTVPYNQCSVGVRSVKRLLVQTSSICPNVLAVFILYKFVFIIFNKRFKLNHALVPFPYLRPLILLTPDVSTHGFQFFMLVVCLTSPKSFA